VVLARLAEAIEDLGETGKHHGGGRDGSRGGPRGGSHDGRSRGPRSDAGPAAREGDAERPRRRRPRRRTRGGQGGETAVDGAQG
jgi:hypothetical protein